MYNIIGEQIRNCSPENPCGMPESHAGRVMKLLETRPALKKTFLQLIANKSIVILPDSVYRGGNHDGF